jgi:hypothetical protein
MRPVFQSAGTTLLTVLAFVATTHAATVTWNGGAGDFSWQKPANWSTDSLPGSADDVVINAGGGVTITTVSNVTIRSLQCSNNLTVAGGVFRVTGGASVVQGQLTMTNSVSVTLSATGAGTIFTGAGGATANGASFEATGGARIVLPNLTTYSKGASCIAASWRATGAGSALEFPGLSTLTGGSCAGLEVQAASGGTVTLAGLTTVTEGVLTFVANGSNSVVNLAVLTQNLATARILSFQARDGGAIAIPQFPGGPTARVTLESGGVIPVGQLRELDGFTVSGMTVDFPALTNLTAGNVTVRDGAVVTLPSVTRHHHGTRCATDTWLVSGAGSVLDLSSLASLTGPSCGYLNLQATAGGRLALGGLPGIAEGTLYFLADGANSLVDLTSLQSPPTVTREISFTARNGGAFAMPQFTGGLAVTAVLESGGALPVGQFRSLNGFSVTGTTVEFTALTNLTAGNVTVRGGAVVTAPNLTLHHHGNGCATDTWEVSGAGSVLDLSGLTSLTGPTCGYLNLEATGGGTLVLSNLPVLADGTLSFLAEGAGSLVDLAVLQDSPSAIRTLSFTARSSGVFSMPQFPGGPTVRVSLESGGVLPVAQFRRLNGLMVAGMTVDFPALTNLTAGDILASGGAVVTLPNLASHANGAGCFVNTWEARGAGSVLDLSALTNLTGSTCGTPGFEATAGGRLILNRLAVIADGNLSFLADGTNSMVDLSALTESLAAQRTVSFEARNTGTVLMPLLAGGPSVTVTIQSGGQLSVAQLNLLRGLTVSGTSLELPLITNLFTGNLIVRSGAVLRLPNLVRHEHGVNCTVSTWEVSGAGSVLDLSALTNLTGTTCGDLAIQALAGGTANLSNLATISEGSLSFLADGAGSRVDLAALGTSLAAQRPVSFEVRNAGVIAMPQMIGGPTVGVNIRSNGVMSVEQIRRLSRITASAVMVNFPALTSFDSGTLIVTNGAVVTAPNLLAYVQGGSYQPDLWFVRDAGSVAEFPGLGQLTGAACGALDLQSVNGGQLRLGGLTNILSGTVHVLSTGTGSVVNLRSLANFLNPNADSRLTATNGGTILLNEQPFVLSGVNVNFAAGSPNLPPTMLGATNLILRGAPWRSYWIEARDATPPGNLWEFFQRVPLTNEFQILGPPAAANREFRVWEFTADPFALELTALPFVGVKVVLYAPANRTYEVHTVANLAEPVAWETTYTVAMTNSFRILPTEPLTNPYRFFRVRPLP